MNSLLKRQIRKYLSDQLKPECDMESFLEAVSKSYDNFDDQFEMIQRSMRISSQELFEANKQLKLDAARQENVISKLKQVIDTLEFFELPDNEQTKGLELDGSRLVEFIDNQTKDIIEMNKQREKLLKDLEIQNQHLSDYAHMVSHDLKSPLRSIDALTAWLEEDYREYFDANGTETMRLIRTNVEKMDTLISGILLYSTIDDESIEQYNVDLDSLLSELKNTIFIPDNVELKVNNKLPTIKGDKYRLQQLFQNLIDNAIKYNDKEKGIVEIGFENNPDHWTFYVKDNGKGIEKKYHDKIFKTFQKLENNPNSSGIGLSIVRKIIDLYEGSIHLESTVGKGTTFFFTLKK
ncbi:sensor histidine kinase [Urechidicola croceus]|uniref:histidine kinase n=1 Tax=Urechidicola croceus TaxID=1850246 RepID=A0A1D8P7F2_9FLAO|nr:ATP-binding protein [Urechidicola croceus]AOW20496.1 two-component sensor histidine kinase [Urechidicola croceus]